MNTQCIIIVLLQNGNGNTVTTYEFCEERKTIYDESSEFIAREMRVSENKKEPVPAPSDPEASMPATTATPLEVFK